MSSANAPASLEGNKALMVRWFDEVWNQGRRETIKELFATEGVLHDGASTYRGPEEFGGFYDRLRAEFSKFSFRPIVSAAEGDLACMHWSVDFVHTASGTPAHVTGTSVVRIRNANSWKPGRTGTRLDWRPNCKARARTFEIKRDSDSR